MVTIFISGAELLEITLTLIGLGNLPLNFHWVDATAWSLGRQKFYATFSNFIQLLSGCLITPDTLSEL